jgi:predicted dehydrogenase
VLDDDRIDVFANVAADAAHVKPIMAAIERGKHVVCEKPLAATAAEAEVMYRAASAAGVKHLVCFNYRFFPAVRLAWELIHGGDIGELQQASFPLFAGLEHGPLGTVILPDRGPRGTSVATS